MELYMLLASYVDKTWEEGENEGPSPLDEENIFLGVFDSPEKAKTLLRGYGIDLGDSRFVEIEDDKSIVSYYINRANLNELYKVFPLR